VLIVFAPSAIGVYVNVADGTPVVRLTFVGVNVPALSVGNASVGVTITVATTTPPTGSDTVKLVDATPLGPVLGPVNEYEVATAVNASAPGSVKRLSFVTVIVRAPYDPGVYTKFAEGMSLVSSTDAGLNVPGTPPSSGVTVTGTSTVVPSGNATVNVVPAPLGPLSGPDNKYVVAVPASATVPPFIVQSR
jgi:hypothetical protein